MDQYKHKLTKDDVKRLLANLLLCIDSIRALKYAHTKISPDTILVDSQGKLKLDMMGKSSHHSSLH